MKKIVLSALCIALFFSGTHAMDFDGEPRSERIKRIARGLLVGALLATAIGTDIASVTESVHTPGSTVASPWNETLPADALVDGRECTYLYGHPCYTLPDHDGGVVTNFETCCEGAENGQACSEWCKERQKEDDYNGECVLLKKCTGKTTYDTQFGWSVTSLIATVGAAIERIFRR